MEKDFNELEEMRRQIGLLKKKLDNEAIVNDRVMRRVMKEKVNSVERYLVRVIVIGVCAMLLMYYDCAVLFHLSAELLVFTEVLLLAAVVFIVNNKRLINSSGMMDCNLVEECKKLVRFKKREIRYLYVSIPLLVVWLAWFLLELYERTSDPVEGRILVISCIIGGILGAVIGFNMFRKMLRNINDVIAQIEDTHDDMQAS